MNLVKNLSFRIKMMLMIIPVSLVLVVIVADFLLESRKEMVVAKELEMVVNLSAVGASLVHELQKERGASAGFLGSKGAKFVDALPKQYAETDKRLNEWRKAFDDVRDEISNREILSALDSVTKHLDDLSEKRKRVIALQASVKDTVAFYTKATTQFISSVMLISKESTNIRVTQSLMSFYDFSLAKERAGIERAVMNNVFTANGFAPGVYEKFLRLITEQNAYTSSFLNFATDSQKDFYKQSMDNADVAKVSAYRSLAIEGLQSDNLGVAPVDWFASATGRINQLLTRQSSFSFIMLK